MKQNKRIIKWSLLIIWMVFIFYMSNQPGDISSSQSKIVLDIFRAIGINLNEYWSNIATFIIRKTAHFTEYYVLYLLLYNVIHMYEKNKKQYMYSLIVVFLYSCSDELHQYFIPGRCMAVKDILIDTMGGIIAMITCMFYKRIKE